MQRNKQQFRMVRILVLMIMMIFISIQSTNGDTKRMEAASLETPSFYGVSRTTKEINLKISKSALADGYQVYRSEQKNGTYSKIKTLSSLEYKDKDVKNTKSYYYKVRAYKKVNGKNTYSKFSKVQKINSVLGKVTNLKAYSTTNSNTLTWSNVKSATSYGVYRANSESGKYTYLGSSKSNYYIDETAKAGTKYFYKARAYAVTDGVKYYGSYSSIISHKRGTYTTSNAGNVSSSDTSKFAEEVLRLVNSERAKQGLSSLSTTQALENAANHRAKEIVQQFSHTRPDGTSCFTVLGDYNVSYMACGENIAYGQRTPEEVMNAWMNSEGHRKNIMSANFGKMGVGVYVNNGVIYWVQMFTN